MGGFRCQSNVAVVSTIRLMGGTTEAIRLERTSTPFLPESLAVIDMAKQFEKIHGGPLAMVWSHFRLTPNCKATPSLLIQDSRFDTKLRPNHIQ
jgi:hypothetical protein